MVLLEAFFLIISGILGGKSIFKLNSMHLNCLVLLIRVYPTSRALAVVWTSPLVAALAASLTIPLGMVEDILIYGQHYSIIYVIGSAQVNEVCHYYLFYRALVL